MIQTSRLFRFFAMPSASEVRAFATNEGGPLLGFGLFGSLTAKAVLAKLLPRFRGALVFAACPIVPFREMLFRCNPFKIVGAVISLVAILVMHVLFVLWIFEPARGDNSVHEAFSAERQVSVDPVGARLIGSEISKNFPAARYGKEMVKQSIFDTVYFDADHVVPFGRIEVTMITQTMKGLQT